MKYESKIILVIVFFLSVLVYQLWSPLKEHFDIKIFYPGISLMILGFLIIIWSECEGRFKLFCEAFMWLGINNFTDELFFDPTIIQLHEYIAFVLILVNLLFKWTKHKKTNYRN
jgi:uncharacterized membrane protein